MRETPGSDDYLAALGRAVRTHRQRLGRSQEQFALDVELDRTYISGIERGVRNPTISTLLRLARAFDVTPSSLLRSAERSKG